MNEVWHARSGTVARGKSAHLSVEGPRGQAIRRALAD